MRFMNRLKSATSPYLLQHADNPVDWWPWSDEAFDEARRRDVPVLLSVGYAACHWCHVMAHESFEDPATARGDERAASSRSRSTARSGPDIDAVYMSATQAMTGQGGWPMTVFMTPDGEPFYCGTYFPRAQFASWSPRCREAWRENRARIRASRSGSPPPLAENAAALSGLRRPAGELDLEQVADAAVAAPGVGLRRGQRRLRPGAEVPALDGAGVPAPPPRARPAAAAALSMAEATCEAMARGGMYDQLGGGFARYSVDAELGRAALREDALRQRAAGPASTRTCGGGPAPPLARRVAEETCDFMVRELRTAEGGLAASLDADSDGGEGAFYVWTPAELARGPRARTTARSRPGSFGVTEDGHVRARRVGPAAPADPRPAPGWSRP